MKYGITLIPGDGIGTEVSEAAVRVVEACGLDIEWDRVDAGANAVEKHGTTLPDEVLASIRERKVAIKGPLTTPVGKGFVSVNVTLRKKLELYVSLRPVNSLAGVETPYKNVDLVVFRENTEGLYSGLEHEPVPGVVETLRVSSEKAARRLTRFAYDWCRFEGRRKVHLVHKASDLKLADGQFLDVAHHVAADYPYIETQDILMSRVCMDLAMAPESYDVLIMENLFGDILSDLCAGLVGGLGVVPGANIGDHYAVFEAVHGSAPDIAGKGVANPIALTRSAALMCKHIGEREAAQRIEKSIGLLLERGETLTPDLGGTATTTQVTDAIIRGALTMSHTVTLIPGDSLGAELAPVVKRVVEAVGVEVQWETAAAGREAFEATGDPVPPETLDCVRRNKIALKGRIWTPIQTGYRSPDQRLHKALDLYAAKRRIRNLPGIPSRHEGVDLVIIQECTEDVNVGLEHELLPGVTQSIKITTRDACLRIARYAFEFAKRLGRERVTLVHKANIMKRSDGLFIRCGEEVAADYPEIKLDTIIADNACMQLVARPQQFDVLLAQNLFGEILSAVGAGLVGGISAVWGELAGDEDLRVYEVMHGFAPGLAGKGIANPLPFLMPVVAMLHHLGEKEAGDRLRLAVMATLQAGIKSPDLGGDADTETFTSAIIDRLD